MKNTLSDKLFHFNMNGERIPHSVNPGPCITCTQCTMIRCGKDFVENGVELAVCVYCASKNAKATTDKMAAIEALAKDINHGTDGPVTPFVLIARACEAVSKGADDTVAANALYHAMTERGFIVGACSVCGGVNEGNPCCDA